MKHSRTLHAEMQRIQRGAWASWASVQLSSENLESVMGNHQYKVVLPNPGSEKMGRREGVCVLQVGKREQRRYNHCCRKVAGEDYLSRKRKTSY